MDFYDFSRFLEKSGCRSHPTLKLCAGLCSSGVLRYWCARLVEPGGALGGASRTMVVCSWFLVFVVSGVLVWRSLFLVCSSGGAGRRAGRRVAYVGGVFFFSGVLRFWCARLAFFVSSVLLWCSSFLTIAGGVG